MKYVLHKCNIHTPEHHFLQTICSNDNKSRRPSKVNKYIENSLHMAKGNINLHSKCYLYNYLEIIVHFLHNNTLLISNEINSVIMRFLNLNPDLTDTIEKVIDLQKRLYIGNTYLLNF